MNSRYKSHFVYSITCVLFVIVCLRVRRGLVPNSTGEMRGFSLSYVITLRHTAIGSMPKAHVWWQI